MTLTPENLRYILGLKVKALRQRRGVSLTELAAQSGLSVSYLSEIENGRKFPTPEKLIQLADTFEIGYEELVSPQLSGELDPLAVFFRSEFVTEFPFGLFGLQAGDLLGLVKHDPAKAAAFVQTFLEIGRSYDMQVEQFLLASLRTYQRLHANYFPELEEAAREFRLARGWSSGGTQAEGLREWLEDDLGYVIVDDVLPSLPELANLRSVFLPGDPPRLLVNPQLAPSQRAFIYGREIGFRELQLDQRERTPTWLRVESFEQVLSDFKASYFSGALMVDGDVLANALAEFLSHETWDSEAYTKLMRDFGATPELFAYRVSQVLPGRLGLDKLYFMRFHHLVGTDQYEMNKMLNLTGMAVPRGVGLTEHYCRRWVTTRALKELDERLEAGEGRSHFRDVAPLVRAERVQFVQEGAEFFVITVALPLREPNKTSSITLGFLIDESFKRVAKFWDDPSLKRTQVGLTCERCPIPAEGCELRRVGPVFQERALRQERQAEALRRLREEGVEAAIGGR